MSLPHNCLVFFSPLHKKSNGECAAGVSSEMSRCKKNVDAPDFFIFCQLQLFAVLP